MKVWRHRTDLPGTCRVPGTRPASSLPVRSKAATSDGCFCKLPGEPLFLLEPVSHLRFSVSPCPSLADDLPRCLFLNCQSICLAPGARREDDLFHRLSGHRRGCFAADREATAAPEQLCILLSAAQISLCNSFSWVRRSQPLHQQQLSFSPDEPAEPIKRSMLCLLEAL